MYFQCHEALMSQGTRQGLAGSPCLLPHGLNLPRDGRAATAHVADTLSPSQCSTLQLSSHWPHCLLVPFRGWGSNGIGKPHLEVHRFSVLLLALAPCSERVHKTPRMAPWPSGGQHLAEDIVHFSPSADTTRPQKKNEVDGKDYYFVSTEEMTRDISANEFLEFGSYQGNMFGTKFETVHKIHQQDKVAILDIEPQVGSRGSGGQNGDCCRLDNPCVGCDHPCTPALPQAVPLPLHCLTAPRLRGPQPLQPTVAAQTRESWLGEVGAAAHQLATF